MWISFGKGTGPSYLTSPLIDPLAKTNVQFKKPKINVNNIFLIWVLALQS